MSKEIVRNDETRIPLSELNEADCFIISFTEAGEKFILLEFNDGYAFKNIKRLSSGYTLRFVNQDYKGCILEAMNNGRVVMCHDDMSQCCNY